MKIKRILPGIIQVDFDDHVELAMTFLRFQEHYESPEFKDKIFTLGQFKEWYAQDNESGSFSYPDDWGGFNIPSRILDVFRLGLFDPLTYREMELLERLPAQRKPFYVIGTYKGGDDNVLEHETCHGLFYTDEEYRLQVCHLLSLHKRELKPLEEYLRPGYHPSVFQDECHAYISADHEYLKKKGIKFPDIVKELHKLRDQAIKRLEKK